ncbi:MAG TPA: LuxR C-terminal-related transcriptional regulator [Vicinamibacterales bacterium]
MTDSTLVRGRDAFQRQRWGEAYTNLAAAGERGPLDPDDLECLALASYLSGQDPERTNASLARAHQAFLERGQTTRAVRAAFYLAFSLIHLGEIAQATGWTARAQRLLDEHQIDCVERGYLLVPLAVQAALTDTAAAAALFADAAAIGDRFGDPNLASLARQGHGRALVRQGEITAGTALLDEAMVAVTAGDVQPGLAGTIYCSVIATCVEMLDIRRAQEWTDALHRWCQSQPELVPYRGDCLIHRAEIMLAHGDWSHATGQAQLACEYFSHTARRLALGAAWYLIAEVCRLQGDSNGAEAAYRRASETGRTPQPGLALLWLAQGRRDAAKAAVGHALDAIDDRRLRSRTLAAYVEILLAAGDVDGAGRAAQELEELTATLKSPLLTATSDQANGAVLLARGEARRALVSLRRARTIWRELDVPYEVARANVLVGLACRALGDCDSGDMELASARHGFEALGASPDVARLDALLEAPATKTDNGLTSREVEVLRLIASGKTNRTIAHELRISEKTVARHVSNIFTKLDVPSRAAATAYAFQHRLV